MVKDFTHVYHVQPIPATRPRLGRHGTYNTKRYSDYLKELILLTQVEMKRAKHKGFGSSKIRIDLYFGRNDKRRCDIDNLAKGVLDAIVKASLIEDDQYIYQLNLTKTITDNPFITLKVKRLNND